MGFAGAGGSLAGLGRQSLVGHSLRMTQRSRVGKVRRRSDGAKSFDECELRGVADPEIRCERGGEDGSRWRGKLREVGVRALYLAANRLIQHRLADTPGMPGDARGCPQWPYPFIPYRMPVYPSALPGTFQFFSVSSVSYPQTGPPRGVCRSKKWTYVESITYNLFATSNCP